MRKFIPAVAVSAMLAVSASAFGAEELKGPVNLTFAAQEVGTAAYTYATALQTVMLKELPSGSKIAITTTSPGGVGAPIIVNNAVKTDIVMSNSAPAKWSMEDGILGKPKTENIAALAGGLGHDFINVMFTKKFVDKTGIKTVEELVAKKYPVKIVIKKNGTLGELSAEKVFEALGAKLEDVKAWGGTVEKTGGDAIKSGLQDDLYDMTVDHIGAGQSNTTELCLTHDMYDVQLGDETLKKLVDMGYDYVTVEPNTWKGQTEAIKTVGSQQLVLVSTTMDNAVAYNLTKALCEHAAELGDQVAALKFFDPKKAGSKQLTGVPLHPGAAEYYKEKGYAAE
ncbi:MAG: TAXI family TRAP transporter solute-binding subunit [Succinivibrio sp.]|jgi:TRAP transporter TAXI family solute receptor|nr:TAXI family TRAP transporter solute-binding subunit [Succinivibrio sp.]